MDSGFHSVHRPVSSPANAGFLNSSGPSTTDNRSGNHSDDFISGYRRSRRFNNHTSTHQLSTASTTFNLTNKADNSPEIPDAQILKIKLEKNGSYEAKILVNAQTYELKITSAGEIVKIETED
jgi:hypothetical protein